MSVLLLTVILKIFMYLIKRRKNKLLKLFLITIFLLICLIQG